MFGLFESEETKLRKKLAQKFSGIDVDREIAKIRESSYHSQRRSNDVSIMDYILMYGLFSEPAPVDESITTNYTSVDETYTSYTSYTRDDDNESTTKSNNNDDSCSYTDTSSSYDSSSGGCD